LLPSKVFFAVAVCWLLVGCGLTVDTNERMERAAAALSNGDAQSAVLEARRVLQSEPDRGDARLLLARAFLEIGAVEDSAREYARAVELGVSAPPLEHELMLAQKRYAELLSALDTSTEPANDSTALLRAAAHAGNGDDEAAMNVLVELKTRSPQNVAAANAIARIHLARGDIPLALAELETAAPFAAEDIDFWQVRGTALLSGGRYGDAAEALKHADELLSARGAADPYLLAALVQASLGVANTDDAASYAERLTKLVPDAPATSMVSAQVAVAQGRDGDAVALLQRLLADDPQNSAAAFLLGSAQLRQGRLGQALAQFRAVLARHPEHLAARKLAAATQIRMGQPSEALGTLGPSLTQNVTDPEVYDLAGRANLMLGDTAAASELYARGAGEPNDEYRRKLEGAAALLASGDQPGALALLETVPDSQDATYARDRLRIAAHVASGNRAAATSIANQLVATHGRDSAALNLAGLVYREVGDLDRAESVLREALTLDPKSVAVYSSLVKLLLQRGATIDARQLTGQLIENESDLTADERLEAANLMAMAGDPEVAADRLRKLPIDDRGAFRARLSGARHLADRGFPELSEQLIEQLPSDITPQDQTTVGSIALSLGQADRALAIFTAAANAPSDQPEIRVGQALAQMQLGQRQFARSTLQALVAEKPAYVPGLVLLARIQQLDGDTNAALATARSVREIEPQSPVADALSGDLFVEQKDYARAAESYRNASQKSPSRVWAVKSFRAAVSGDVDRPGEVLEEWLASNERDIAARELLAQYYLNERDSVRAVANYEKLLAMDADNAAYLNNLAWLHIEKNPRRALELAERALKAQPESAAVADTLGWTLVKVGRSPEAVPLLRRAATLDDPEIRYHLAVALAESNAVEEAQTLFDQVLKSNVSSEIRQDTQAWLDKL
jgi:cellulose synthase operon protein C